MSNLLSLDQVTCDTYSYGYLFVCCAALLSPCLHPKGAKFVFESNIVYTLYYNTSNMKVMYLILPF